MLGRLALLIGSLGCVGCAARSVGVTTLGAIDAPEPRAYSMELTLHAPGQPLSEGGGW
jgi:hypothetical protein